MKQELIIKNLQDFIKYAAMLAGDEKGEAQSFVIVFLKHLAIRDTRKQEQLSNIASAEKRRQLGSQTFYGSLACSWR